MKNCFLLLALLFALTLAKAQSSGLAEAIHAGDPAKVKVALEAGAEIEVLDAKGRTPLLMAISTQGNVPERQKKIVVMLLDAGANANAADERGYTALHYAAFQSSFDLIDLLLAKKADPNLLNEADESPLILAARGPLMDDDRLKTFEKLLAANASPQTKDIQQRSALHLLCAHEPKLESPQVVDEMVGQLSQMLHDKGAPLDEKDSLGNTPFSNAIRAGNFQTAAWLLDKGAKASPSTLANFSALHFATEAGDLTMVDRLINLRLNINLTTGEKRQANGQAYFYPKGSTPLDLALISEHERKNPDEKKAWKSLASALKQRGGTSKTFDEYVKGFHTMKGGSPQQGSSKILPKR